VLRDIRCAPRVAWLFVWLASCASTATSETHVYELGESALRISARAERGATRDQLFIVVNGEDVASGPFGPPQAAGAVLRGHYEGTPIEAHCGHRWRPGIHIGYRCAVYVDGDGPIALDF
jgi:hypothetical protein